MYAAGFLNIDQNPRDTGIQLIENVHHELPNKKGAFVMKYDLRNGIPTEDDTIKNLYHSHFLEHLTKSDGINFLQNCFRVLKPNGIMRLAIPDFKLWCYHYTNNNIEFFNWYSANFCKKKSNLTHMEIFNQLLYHDHRCMYDFEMLHKILSNIGFTNITQQMWGVTDSFCSIDDLEKLDSKRKPESLVIECEK